MTYTRYADDLFFSASAPGVLAAVEAELPIILANIDCPAGLQVNKAKTRHSSKKRRRRVTGLVLGSAGEVSVGRHLKREIRALIHRYDSLDKDAKTRLAGTLAYINGVEPNVINRLIMKYGAAVIAAARRPPV